MKRNILAALAAACALALGGCTSLHTAPDDRRVTVAPALGDSIWVTDVRMAKGRSQCYTLQANIANNTSSVAQLEYCVIWLDSTGMEISTLLSGWQFASLAPREVRGLTATAPSPDACDFRFYVQPAR